MRRIRIYFLFFFSIVLSGAVSASSSQDDSTLSHGKIVFEGIANGYHELHVLDVATKKDKILYRDKYSDFSPQMSPDGTLVAFNLFDFNDNRRRIYMVDVASGKSRLFLEMPQSSEVESWSPDSSQLLISSGGPWQNDLYVINKDGTGLKQITNDANRKSEVSWHPDGSRVICTKTPIRPMKPGHSPNFDLLEIEIWAVNSDGSGETYLSHGRNPRWNADGSRIVFVKGIETGELCVVKDRVGLMDAAGNFLGFLSYDEFDSLYCPSLNFDGSQVAFMRHFEIRIVDVKEALAGEIVERAIIPSERAQGNDYCWSPDGSQIIFPASDNPEQPFRVPSALYVVNFDGSNSRALTGHEWYSIDLEWLLPTVPKARPVNPSSPKF